MKLLPILVVAILGSSLSFGQGLELIDRQDNYQTSVGQILSIPLKLKNTTDKAQFYVFRRIQDDFARDQKAYFCVDKNCLEPDIDEISKRIEPGETLQNLNFTLETGLLGGQHFIRFEIFPKGNPNQAIEQTVVIAIDARAHIFSSKDITVHDVYPNPAADQAFIDYSAHSDAIRVKILIHNILGKQLSEYELLASETRIKIQTEDLPSGVYFYTLYINNQGVLTRKLVIRK
jgi:hypothetical protein